ncbi:MAG: signal peptide peptidase SppA [Phycisphaerales bacterium]|nr:MAG: signal peptide peptidase SppA [Phycisphaerales bacterium]
MILLRRCFAAFLMAVLIPFHLTASSAVLGATVPVFRLDGTLAESPSELASLLGETKPSTLYQVVSRMKQAAEDPQVPGVVVLLESPSLGFAQIQELVAAMGRLREADKKVHVFAESLDLETYMLSAGASDITVVPSGTLMLTGLRSEAVYVRGLLDKIGVQADIVRIGDFKDAGEMLVRSEPSEESLEQMNRLLDDIYAQILEAVGTARQMDRQRAEAALTEGPYTSERALELGLIDAVRYRKDFLDRLKLRYEADLDPIYGTRKTPALDFSSPFAVFQLLTDLMQEVKPLTTGASIAVVNVEGLIAEGKSTDSGPMGKISGSRTLRKALAQAEEDDSIKAVVLRVASPGGSALASEIMWNGTQRIRRVKPFIVSMGDVAASGGYYVSCGADHIFAEAGTITGSIGVVGGKLVTTGMWEKLGVNWHEQSRGRHATLFSSSSAFSDAQREVLRSFMEETYETFKSRVSDGRGNRLKGALEPMAGGRVYTGRQALEIGLVDEIGGLQDALAHAAKHAGLHEYKVRLLPEPKTIMDLLREALGLPDDSDLLGRADSSVSASPLLNAALPLLDNLSPAKKAAVVRAMLTAELLANDNVILIPPFELVVR